MSSTRSKRRPITALSPSAARRLLEQEAATLYGMRRLLPESALKPSRASNDEEAPSCTAVLPMHYCAAAEIAQPNRRAKSAYSCLALVDWGARSKGSVQFHRTRKGWKLASLTLGPPAKALHRAVNQAGPAGKAYLLVVPHLRLTVLSVASPASLGRRLQVIQGGLTTLRAGSTFSPEILQERLLKEDRKHAAAVKRSLEHARSVAAKLRPRKQPRGSRKHPRELSDRKLSH
jgi:hypothetical protein